ncbi:vomeronasal type-1 receptor 4-like [Meriones unguiculatus]|uniref:vomeronasal type-1 receptor 4-like n=1 Tax=Meriones unguiculatus TaxID=10047 RepID=UPI000B4F2E0B|nr:vomeronasal type-1 receptor 4-like [Meriones unguiculatus]
MDFWNLAIRIIFLLQTITGILGNFSLMFHYLLLYYRECTLKTTDFILVHQMTANSLIILSSGVPHTMAAFGLKQFLNDFACRFLIFIQGFSRTVSIGSTCFLSVFQAMTISPRESFWKDYKIRTAKYTGCSISLLWVLSMWVNFIFFMYTFIKDNNKNMTNKRDFGYCYNEGHNNIIDSLYITLVVCSEVFFSVLIALSSSSMIVILYRHKQKVQHIHSSHGSSRTSPESRATQKILILVSTFLAFYTLSTILRGCIAVLGNHNWWLVTINHFTSLCFPSIEPFVFMGHYSFVSRLILDWISKKKILILF